MSEQIARTSLPRGGVMGHEGSTVIVVLNGLIQLLLWPELTRRREERQATA